MRDTNLPVSNSDIALTLVELFHQQQIQKNEIENNEGEVERDIVPWRERQQRIVNWNENQPDFEPHYECHQQQADDDPELETEIVPQQSFDSYCNMLDEASAYHSLLATVRREIALAPVEPNHMETVRRKISEALPPQKISRYRQSPMHEATIQLEWNPLAFFAAQKYDLPPHQVAKKVIVLTGSHTVAQAMTCGEYMSQTWPSTGTHTLQCFVDMLQDEQCHSQDGESNTYA